MFPSYRCKILWNTHFEKFLRPAAPENLTGVAFWFLKDICEVAVCQHSRERAYVEVSFQ